MLKPPPALRCLSLLVLVILGSLAFSSPTNGQPTLLPARPNAVGGQLRRKLVQLQNHLNNEQWRQYGQLIAELLDEQSDGLIAVAGSREEKLFVDFTEYCQRQLSQAPAPALAAYRRLVDSRAELMFRQGVAELDEQVLQQVADQMFCSSWGDDALWALGELSLHRGDYLAARAAWQKLDGVDHGLRYPDSPIDPAEVAARLALVSIRASQWDRAEQEIRELAALYPQAQGTWGGRKIVFAEELALLLDRAQQLPSLPAPEAWPTVGGSFQRTQLLPQSFEGNLELAWQFSLAQDGSAFYPPPIVSEQLVIFQDTAGVHGLDRETGEQSFLASGELFRQPVSSLTACDDRVLGVMGHQCWAIDADRDGALSFRLKLDGRNEQLLGAGLVDGTHILFELRSPDQFSRVGIACFDLATRKLVWKKWVASANVGSPTVGSALAASPGVVYLCTNLGAIAAVRVEDGRVLWLRTYSRGVPGQTTAHACSCLLTSSTLLVSPTDSRQLLALDPTNGEVLWTRSGIDPAGVLVGATDDRIVLSNNGLHILNVSNGDVVASNFESIPVGQCLLVGDVVFVPTEQEIRSIALDSGEQIGHSIPLPSSGRVDLLGCKDFLLAIGGQQLSMFRVSQDTQRTSDGSE